MLAHTTSLGRLVQGDALEWLRDQPTESVDLVVADPPYGANNKVHWDRFGSLDEYVQWSEQWITECARVLKPHGSLFVCGYSESLAYLKVMGDKVFPSCHWLVWAYRNKHAPWKTDWGRAHESILHFRRNKKFKFNQDAVRLPYNVHTLRYPDHPQAKTSNLANRTNSDAGHVWQPHPLGAKPKDVFDISTLSNGMGERTKHPTQKPEDLIRRFVLACSDAGDLVVDPFGGSGTTLVVAEKLERRWVGVEREPEYIGYAIERLNRVVPAEAHHAAAYRVQAQASVDNRKAVRSGRRAVTPRNGRNGTDTNAPDVVTLDGFGLEDD